MAKTEPNAKANPIVLKQGEWVVEGGLTKRELFAKEFCMFNADSELETINEIAANAVALADALIAALNQ